jgi:hypothetical protein
MYNGQFAKAFIHVVIFGTLIAISDHVAGFADVLFGLMIAFFWFYMVFDAYKTAQARQLGLPAPDLLGIHRLFGIHDATMPAASAAPVAPAVPASSAADYDSVSNSAVTAPPVVPDARGDQPPTGAIILIGLGVCFLLSNFGMLNMGRMWPLLIIGLGLWIAFKRTIGFNARSNQ